MAKKIKVKPGKTQSKFGMIVGIAFVIIGIVAVIPMTGAFGILWTAMAAFITYSNYKNAYTKEGMASRVIEIEDDEDWIREGSRDFESDGEETIETKLEQLESLYEKGLITIEEYEAKRKEILDRI